jgi:hypothetical protein
VFDKETTPPYLQVIFKERNAPDSGPFTSEGGGSPVYEGRL